MIEDQFISIFGNTQMPVIVCERSEGYPVIFANASVKLLINPLLSKESMKEAPQARPLAEVLRFADAGRYESLVASLEAAGIVERFQAKVTDHEGIPLSVAITANLITLEGRAFYVMYVLPEGDEGLSTLDVSNALTAVFQLANQTPDASEAIGSVLAYTGSLVRVSRTYIFEEISAETTRNTYEWCAPGVEPAIQDLQNLRKEDYNYDIIMNSGMYVTDDVRTLPEGDREILEMQGIKALAILPMYHAGRPMGYVGYDDCVTYRNWSRGEILLLENVTNILVSLIARRDTELGLRRSVKVMQLISDNIDNVIYVSDVDTFELVFLNKTLADTLGLDASTLVGKPCWQTLQEGMEGPCTFCPVPKMLAEGYRENGGVYTWEFQNTVTGKWYLLKDSIIKWIDGRDVHIETATEITSQKRYEEQLKQYASMDMMTGTYNREWGYRLIQEAIDKAAKDGVEASIVFIDLDGLKYTNDTFGHDAGDDMILEIVRAIRASTRKGDALCRWGGDEFVLVLECRAEIAERIITDAKARLVAINERGEKPYRLDFSYGIASLLGDGIATVDEVVSCADKRMYEDKTLKRTGEAR